MATLKASSNLKTICGSLKSVSKTDLNLKTCLFGGMSFRWRAFAYENSNDVAQFIGVINKRIYLLKQCSNQIDFVSWSNDDACLSEIESELRDYFRLDENLCDLYTYWSTRDKKFNDKTKLYPEVLNGIRVLRLNPVENLFSFICSSNNNIKRITQMVSNMSSNFGKLIGRLNDVDYHQFPTVNRLAENDVEEKLRKLSFGYRAKFIHQAAVHIKKNHGETNGEEWLYSMRNAENSYELVHQELTKIPGIGKKVADCICLMSMDKLEAIPVDTHVLSLARSIYKFAPNSSSSSSKTNSLTDKTYWEIANKFRELWGKYAGWAQTVMFIDDLKSFDKDKQSTSSTPSSTNTSMVDEKDSSIKKEKVETNELKREASDLESNVNSSEKRAKIELKEEPIESKKMSEINKTKRSKTKK